MNNKGFTLVELLAVIVILVSISFIVMSSISSSLQRRDKSECNEQIALAKNAAKIYLSLNGGTSVTVATLKSKGYFNDDQKIDKLKDTDRITFNSSGYTYSGTTCD